MCLFLLTIWKDKFHGAKPKCAYESLESKITYRQSVVYVSTPFFFSAVLSVYMYVFAVFIRLGDYATHCSGDGVTCVTGWGIEITTKTFIITIVYITTYTTLYDG